MSDEVERTRGLMSTDDAMVWATEFCRIFEGQIISDENEAVNAGTMVAWFANCMQVAVDMYERRKLRDKQLNQATEHVSTEAREAFVAGVEDGREIDRA